MSELKDNANSSAPKRRRWVMPVLFVSLALNLLVVGALVGRAVSPDAPHKKDRIAGPLRSVIGEPFLRALDKEDRRTLLKELRQETPRILESRKTLRTRFQAFLTAVRAEPFDRAVVEELFTQQTEAAQERQALGQTLLLNRLTEMTAEERNTYADRLEDGLKHLKRR